jgi:hypothetical protein
MKLAEMAGTGIAWARAHQPAACAPETMRVGLATEDRCVGGEVD